MATTNLPGDWNVSGNVVVGRSEMPADRTDRREILWTLAWMIRAGQTVVAANADGQWITFIGEHRGASRAECRKAARAILASI